MIRLNPQAENLNSLIKKDSPVVFNLLSRKGQQIYFPKQGILSQTAQAKKTKINATIGMALEEDKTPMRLSQIASKVLLKPSNIFPYASSFGKDELRSLWLKEIKKKNPTLSKTSLPTVTSALTHALSIIGYLFINPGDQIILPDKFWGNYKLIFENGFGAKLTTFNTFKKAGLDIESFKTTIEKVGKKKKKIVVLFNFPNNPTGYTPKITEAKKLTALIKSTAQKGKEILVIIDDAYFGLVYKAKILKQSIFSLLSHIHKNVLSIKLDAITKEEYAWGLRIGFVTYACQNLTKKAYEALEAKTAGAIRGSISNAAHLSQSLILECLTSSGHKISKKEKYNILKARFQLVERVVKRKKYSRYFSPLPFNSGYFMCVELSKKLNAEKVRQLLIKKYSTGVISQGNLLRIAYSSVARRDIPTLFENIYQGCKDISQKS